MTTLHDQLEEVADLGGAGLPVPQAEVLWRRGHRWRNRRRAGTTVLIGAACLALVGLGMAGWQTSTHDDLRPASSPAGLPDRVWEPSPTLPGTDSTGPLGRLAIVISADRAGWWGSESEPLGISAETGEYAFLDLPRWGSAAVLSPDGRRVAYWVTGTPTGSPPEEGKPITGFAVYDTSSGEARSQQVPTEHTMGPRNLVWADDDTLVAVFSQQVGGRGDSLNDQSSGRSQTWWVWRLEETEAGPDAALTEAASEMYEPDGGGHGLIWGYGADGLVVLAPREPAVPARTVSLDEASLAYVAAADATGNQAAAVTGNKNPASVTWASADGPQGKVPGTRRTFRVLAWVDESRLLLLRSPEPLTSSEDYKPALSLVDLSTGEHEDVTTPVDTTGGFDPILNRDVSVAWELATEPTFKASQPPDPIDQRLLLGGAITAVLSALVALRFWRRRVEP